MRKTGGSLYQWTGESGWKTHRTSSSPSGDQGLVHPTPEEEEEVIVKRLRQRMEIPKWKIELIQSFSWPSY